MITAGVMMRGTDEASGSLFSYVDLEARIPARHPLRKIRQVVNDALASLDGEFEALYTDFGRPSIPPERLIRASLMSIGTELWVRLNLCGVVMLNVGDAQAAGRCLRPHTFAVSASSAC